MLQLGISAYYHDSAAAIVRDGDIVAAAQEERFSRRKHDARFPVAAVRYCLEAANTDLAAVDQVVFYDKPFLKFERLLETYLAFAPAGFASFVRAMPVWLKEKLFQKKLLLDALQAIDPHFTGAKLLFSEHHLAHAASAFYPSPFREALILTMDGVGEWVTTSVMHGKDNTIRPLKEIHFPHSIGLLYSAFTYYTGFKVNSGEYKLMGLAPYGQPIYADVIRKELVDIKPDGSLRLNMRYFDYCTGLRMTNRRFNRLFGRKPRAPESPVTQLDMNLAASIQTVTEDIVLTSARHLRGEYGLKNLCLAGGVALNCVANGKLLASGIFDHLWIQPAAGDAGGALGAALLGHHHYHGMTRAVSDAKADLMHGAFLGPSFSDEEAQRRLSKIGARFERLAPEQTIVAAAGTLAQEKVVGWFQGRMEFGPRALGARSILGDARSPRTQSTMNLKIKYRESFRPFAPSVLREDVAEYFELDTDSPYMLLVAPVQMHRRCELSADDRTKTGLDRLHIPKSDIPAVTHVDYSARVQTVERMTNPRYHALIDAFKQRTGYGLVVNTSFNVRGEPPVCTPEDAFRCFMGTEMDELYVGNLRLEKSAQDQRLRAQYTTQFAAD